MVHPETRLDLGPVGQVEGAGCGDRVLQSVQGADLQGKKCLALVESFFQAVMALALLPTLPV